MNGGVFHSLGAVPSPVTLTGCVALAAGVVGAAALLRRTWSARRRGGALMARGAAAHRHRPRWLALPGAVAWSWVAPVAAGVVADRLVEGVAGVLAGAAAGWGVRRWRRSAAARGAPEPDGAAARLPEAADLLAACLAAGATPVRAADAVGRTVEGPLGHALRRVAAEIRLGGDPAACWQRLAAVPDAADLARWMARASTTGVPPVAAVSRLAAECRAARTRSASARARRAAVLATAPLGLCFLPAFLAVGVVPVVAGLAAAMTGGRG